MLYKTILKLLKENRLKLIFDKNSDDCYIKIINVKTNHCLRYDEIQYFKEDFLARFVVDPLYKFELSWCEDYIEFYGHFNKMLRYRAIALEYLPTAKANLIGYNFPIISDEELKNSYIHFYKVESKYLCDNFTFENAKHSCSMYKPDLHGYLKIIQKEPMSQKQKNILKIKFPNAELIQLIFIDSMEQKDMIKTCEIIQSIYPTFLDTNFTRL